MSRVLVVEDERWLLQLFQARFGALFEVVLAARAREALDQARGQTFDAALIDVRLPDGRGDELMLRLLQHDRCLAVILMSGFFTAELAMASLRRGAFKVLAKPLTMAATENALHSAIARSQQLRAQAAPPADVIAATPTAGLAGRSPRMLALYEVVARLAGVDVPVLVHGETGTGKELVARALHEHSCRKDRPFVTLNCAALSATLIESELFGHEKGAFTGADRQQIGRFEQAQGGTLFLDEVGELPLDLQPKLLRVLQDQAFYRVGGTEVVRTDARIVAATNQDLEALCRAGKFRPDLYYRLTASAIPTPPLREHLEDLPDLVQGLLAYVCGHRRRPIPVVPPEFVELLQKHSWPGNVRELRNFLENAVTMTPVGLPLTVECLPEAVRAGPVSVAVAAPPPGDPEAPLRDFVRRRLQAGGPRLYHCLAGVLERLAAEEAFVLASGNRERATRLLGVGPKTLQARLRARADMAGVDEGLRAFVRRGLREGEAGAYHRLTAVWDRIVVEEALALCGGSERKANRLLGMARMTFRARRQKLKETGERPGPSTPQGGDAPDTAPTAPAAANGTRLWVPKGVGA
jgi:two-component system nitrogen regulation response regulator GlnG